MFKTVMYRISYSGTGIVNACADKDISLTGYTALGVSGYNLDGSSQRAYGYSITDNHLSFSLFNDAPGSRTIMIHIIYAKIIT